MNQPLDNDKCWTCGANHNPRQYFSLDLTEHLDEGMLARTGNQTRVTLCIECKTAVSRLLEKRDGLQAKVWDGLDNAVSNDYRKFLENASSLEVALECVYQDADLETFTDQEIQPYVVSWRKSRNIPAPAPAA